MWNIYFCGIYGCRWSIIYVPVYALVFFVYEFIFWHVFRFFFLTWGRQITANLISVVSTWLAAPASAACQWWQTCAAGSASHSPAPEVNKERDNLIQPIWKKIIWTKRENKRNVGEGGTVLHLHAGDVDPLSDTELLPHQSQFWHAVKHHVVELDQRHENRIEKIIVKKTLQLGDVY